MKKYFIPFSFMLSTAVLISCGNNTNGYADGSSGDLATGTTTDTMNMNTNTMAVGDTDRQFIMEAASGGMLEVEAGRLAEQNARNQRVKTYGAMMVRDHSAANEQLRAIAAARNVMLPDTMMEKHRKHLEMIIKSQGASFDKNYIDHMVMAHNEDINKFQVASNNAQDTAVRGFATRSLPILRMHKDSATAINKNLK